MVDEAHMRKLTINGIQLLDRIDADVAFVTELAAVECITWPQRDHIIEIVHRRDRNDKMPVEGTLVGRTCTIGNTMTPP